MVAVFFVSSFLYEWNKGFPLLNQIKEARRERSKKNKNNNNNNERVVQLLNCKAAEKKKEYVRYSFLQTQTSHTVKIYIAQAINQTIISSDVAQKNYLMLPAADRVSRLIWHLAHLKNFYS